MPNVRKSYDIPIKTLKKKWRSDQFGQFEDTFLFPLSMASYRRQLLRWRSGENDAIVTDEGKSRRNMDVHLLAL
jgi:hypothetical protein